MADEKEVIIRFIQLCSNECIEGWAKERKYSIALLKELNIGCCTLDVMNTLIQEFGKEILQQLKFIQQGKFKYVNRIIIPYTKRYFAARSKLSGVKYKNLFPIDLKKEPFYIKGDEDSPCIIVEGETDAIALKHIYLTYNIFSIGGTTSTSLLTKLNDYYKGNDILLCFDNDSAGGEALNKSIRILNQKKLSKLTFPEQYKDIDEFFKSGDIDTIRKALSIVELEFEDIEPKTPVEHPHDLQSIYDNIKKCKAYANMLVNTQNWRERGWLTLLLKNKYGLSQEELISFYEQYNEWEDYDPEITAREVARYFNKETSSGKLEKFVSKRKLIEQGYCMENCADCPIYSEANIMAPRAALNNGYSLTIFKDKDKFKIQIRDSNETIKAVVSAKDEDILDMPSVENKLIQKLRLLKVAKDKDGAELLVMNAYEELRKSFEEYLSIIEKDENFLSDDEINSNMSVVEEEEALNLLNDAAILLKILEFKENRLGHAGEYNNCILLLLTYTSRKLRKPIGIIVKGDSAGGKSFTAMTMILFVPTEDIRDFTRITPQDLFYVKQDYLKNKLLIIFERPGAEGSDYSIRTLQSERKLKLGIPLKNPRTGDIEHREKIVEGPVAYVETTTKSTIHAENETRVFSCFIDDSEEQTIAIFEKDNQNIIPIDVEKQKESMRLFKNTQRLLKQYDVIVPFKQFIEFPKKPLRVRRDRNQFLAIIDACALLHQNQREKIKIGETEYLIANFFDYGVALILSLNILKDIVSGLPGKSKELLDAATRLHNAGKINNITYKDLMKELDWSKGKISQNIGPCYDQGYLTAIQSGKGKKTILGVEHNTRPECSLVFIKQLEDLFRVKESEIAKKLGRVSVYNENNSNFVTENEKYKKILTTLYALCLNRNTSLEILKESPDVLKEAENCLLNGFTQSQDIPIKREETFTKLPSGEVGKCSYCGRDSYLEYKDQDGNYCCKQCKGDSLSVEEESISDS